VIFTTGEYICQTCSSKAGLGVWLSASEAVQHLDRNPFHEIIDTNAEEN
jgi:hypothetical protein